MKKLKDYLEIENSRINNPVVGDTFSINIREECLVESHIVDVSENSVTIAADDKLIEILESYGMLDKPTNEGWSDHHPDVDYDEYMEKMRELSDYQRKEKKEQFPNDDDSDKQDDLEKVKENKKTDRFKRRYVPGAAKKQIDSKIKDQQFSQILALDGDQNDPDNRRDIEQTKRNIRRLNDLDEDQLNRLKELSGVTTNETLNTINVGNEVIVTGSGRYKGATGVVKSLEKGSNLAVVDLYNYGNASLPISELSINDYANSDEEQEYLRTHTNEDNELFRYLELSGVKHKKDDQCDQRKPVESDDCELDDADEAKESNKMPLARTKVVRLALRSLGFPNGVIKTIWTNKLRDGSNTIKFLHHGDPSNVASQIETALSQKGLVKGKDFAIRVGQIPTHPYLTRYTSFIVHLPLQKDTQAIDEGVMKGINNLYYDFCETHDLPEDIGDDEFLTLAEKFLISQGIDKDNIEAIGELFLDIRHENEKLGEAEYQGRDVDLNKPFLTPGGPKKRSVYVKNPKGNVVKVNFGDKNMRIKKSNPERRKSFRARHNCENPGPKHKARYWSCRFW